MKRKVLSASLAAMLLFSNVAPAFAEEQQSIQPVVVDSASAKPVLPKASAPAKVKRGHQKVLCVMVNMENDPFDKKHNEKFYYNQLFGSQPSSVRSYIRNQSNGNFTISPADTVNSKCRGVIKINAKTPAGYSSVANDYKSIRKFTTETLNQISGKVDWKRIDKNKDHKFQEDYHYNNLDNNEELLIITVISGDARTVAFKKPGHVLAWPHATYLNTNIDGYTLKHSTVITSEYTRNVVNASTLAHEFLHDIGARDMYKDENSIDFWSIMANTTGRRAGESEYTPIPLDPVHKLYFGWKKPKKVEFNSKGVAKIKFNRGEVPYLVDHRNPNIVYLLDYHDLSDSNEKSLNYHGVETDGVAVWKINKEVAKRDWVRGENAFVVNTEGPGTAMKVMSRHKKGYQSVKHSYIPVGTSRSVDGTLYKVEVKNKQLVVYNRLK